MATHVYIDVYWCQRWSLHMRMGWICDTFVSRCFSLAGGLKRVRFPVQWWSPKSASRQVLLNLRVSISSAPVNSYVSWELPVTVSFFAEPHGWGFALYMKLVLSEETISRPLTESPNCEPGSRPRYQGGKMHNMGVPLVIIHFDGIFPYKPSIFPYNMEVSIAMGVPQKRWMVFCSGTYTIKLDENWGCPKNFRKPPSGEAEIAACLFTPKNAVIYRCSVHVSSVHVSGWMFRPESTKESWIWGECLLLFWSQLSNKSSLSVLWGWGASAMTQGMGFWQALSQGKLFDHDRWRSNGHCSKEIQGVSRDWYLVFGCCCPFYPLLVYYEHYN